MSNSPLTKVAQSAFSPVSALSIRRQETVPQALSKQAIELQNTLKKLKEAQQKKQLSNSNLIVQSITNPLCSPADQKHTEESEQKQIQYKSLFKDIEQPSLNCAQFYSKMEDQEAEKAFEQRKEEIKKQINRTKSNCNNISKPKKQTQKKKVVGKNVQKIDITKNSNKKQKPELELILQTPQEEEVKQQQKDCCHSQFKQMQQQLKQDIAKLDREIKGEHQLCLFEIKNKGHDLYHQGQMMEDRKQFKKKIHEREKQMKELEQCTFKPKISLSKRVFSNLSRQQQTRNQNETNHICKSNRDGQLTSKRLSRSHSQDLINNTSTTQIMQNDINLYLNRIQDKYQSIVDKANALKIKCV